MPPPSATTVPTPASGTVAVRYRCGDDYRVEVVDADSARVTLQDGQIVTLPRSPDRARTLYAGEALEFSIDDATAQLARDEGGSWPCTAE